MCWTSSLVAIYLKQNKSLQENGSYILFGKIMGLEQYLLIPIGKEIANFLLLLE